MKKLLCLFLSLLLVLSFAGCATEEHDDALALNNLQEGDDLEAFEDKEGYDYLREFEYMENDENDSSAANGTAISYGYKDAINLMMKTFDNSFTKEELKAMYPEECWTRFEEENGKTLDDIYESFSQRMADIWETSKESAGEDAAVKYEFAELQDCEAQDYNELKATLIEKYGIDETAFGKCYEVRIKRATVGSLNEDVSYMWYRVLEIHENWYVAEVLTSMPII